MWVIIIFTMSSDLDHFVSSLQESPLPSKDLTQLLDEHGLTLLRSNNGCLSYATSGQPESCGRCAVSQQNISGATMRDLEFSNMCIRELKRPDASGKLLYPQIGEDLKLCVIIDSSHRSISKLRPQGAYMIALCS